MDISQARARLEGIALFADLTPDGLSKLVEAAAIQEIPKGEFLIRAGDSADTLYLVLRGRFLVQREGKTIAEIPVGEPVGELAFFTHGVRTANVRAARDSEVLCLTRTAYDEVCTHLPSISQSIISAVSKRLIAANATHEQMRPDAGRIVCMFEAGGAALPAPLVAGVCATFEARADWRVVRQSEAAAFRSDIAGWLRNLEAEGQRLLLVCEEPDSLPEWLEAARSSCDSAFMCGPAHSDTQPAIALARIDEDFMRASLIANTHLIIYRDAATTPITNTNAWLTHHEVGLHHHLALDSGADFARIGRFIRGEAIGLVMSGGGAFGAAHMGALKALYERGFVFDMVGGTSIGSAMGGALALQWAPERAVEICNAIFVDEKVMGRFTFPLHSILDHRKFDAQLEKHCQGVNIQDMPLNFFALATNLRNNDVKIIRRGKLWKAIRASASLPGIFPPFVTSGGDVLLDGGLLDNIPVSPMRHLKAGPNLILRFDHGKEWPVKADYGQLPGRFGVLLRLLKLKKPPKTRFPSLTSVLGRTMVVGARQLMERTRHDGDVMLELSTMPGMSFLDWAKGKKQFDTSCEQVRKVLDDIGVHTAPAGTGDQVKQLAAIASQLSATGRA